MKVAQPGDPLVESIMRTLDAGGWNRDLSAKVIAMVREHDAKDHDRVMFARGFRAGCGANVSDEMDLLRKLRAEWESYGSHESKPQGASDV